MTDGSSDGLRDEPEGVTTGSSNDVGRSWAVTGDPELLEDAAVKAGLDELASVLEGIKVRLIRGRTGGVTGKTIVLEKGRVPEAGDTEIPDWPLIAESSFVVGSDEGENRTIRLRAEGPLGIAYSIFFLADRIRVDGALPRLKGMIHPELPYRIAGCGGPVSSGPEGPGDSDQDLAETRERFRAWAREAVKRGYNFVVVRNTEDYVPWPDEAYGRRSEGFRKHLKEVLDIAHSHHLKVLLMGDELCYHPSLLEKAGASPSVKDERLWDALRTKYRDLFLSLPDLDGVATRIGENIPRYDFQTLDPIHSAESEPDPRIEERYRRFVKVMHEVVVGEFDKIFLHRTWVTNVHEQHSVPQIYSATFTPDVPARNLLISIKLTSGDQWYPYEPYNATFGVTPHTTVAQGELYSGYHGGGSYIEFPARYFQAALEWAVRRGTRGIFNGLILPSDGPRGLTADAILYVFSRLGWNPRMSVEELTKDWAAATFGREVKEEVAEIFLEGSVAVRNGLYIRQPGLRNWEPLRHVRTNDFVLKGNPEWDNGKAHDDFLREVYLECKPWFDQTISELDYGISTCKKMLERFEAIKGRIRDPEKSKSLESLLSHGLAAVRLNAHYVKAFLYYFRYREDRGEEAKALLEGVLADLEGSLEAYRSEFKYYNVHGILAFVDLARRALKDLEGAERRLAESPTEEEIQEMFRRARHDDEEALRQHPEALLIATWKGSVDGRDILRIRGGTFTIEHISDDPIASPVMTTHAELPRDRPCRMVIRVLSKRGTVFIRDQPRAENGYTTTIYVEDRIPGMAPVAFQLFAICEEGG